MDAGSFHVHPITRSGRIIHTDCDAAEEIGSELVHGESEHDGAEFLGRASEADEAIVKAVPIVLHSGGDEPGTGGAAIVGQQHAADDDGQPKGDPRVQAGLQRGDGSEHVTGERHFGLLGFLRLGFLRSSRLRLSCWDFFCFLCRGCGRLDLRLAIRGSPGGVLVVTNSQHRREPRFHQYQSILLHFALLNLIWHKVCHKTRLYRRRDPP